MCGIIGLIRFNKERVSEDIFRALLALQHRGQDSAGIACFDKVRLNLKKGVGLAADVFSEENLALLKGNCGIGHVRYSTIGSSPKMDAPPFSVSIPTTIAMVHNGNIVNYNELRKRFADRTESFCDVEIILHLFAEALAKEVEEGERKEITVEKIFSAVRAAMDALNGSYSVVAVISNKGLLAFRDPHAIRPMVMGKQNIDYAFASETVALDAIGFEPVRDVKPGEAIFVSSNGDVVSRVLKPGKPAHCMFEWVYFSRPDSVLEGKSVYETRLRLGKELAKHYKKKGDEVAVAIPDTSRTAAQGLAEATGIPCREGLIKNRYIPRTFIMPTKEREDATSINLNPVEAVIGGKTVLLVDDSIVRGTTSRKIIHLVKKKAKRVHFFVTCPPIVSPCFYGIDFPIKTELIAARKSVEEIRKFLGLDELTYQSLEGLKKAIGLPGLCTACLTGRYPTPVTARLMKEVAEARTREREACFKPEREKLMYH